MRPPEIDAALSLTQLVVNETEDSGGDEPYLWVLGFKVDADTIGAPSTNPPLPTLNVATMGGGIPWVVGNNSVDNGQVWPIPSALGTRAFRLKPKLLDFGGWFGRLRGHRLPALGPGLVLAHHLRGRPQGLREGVRQLSRRPVEHHARGRPRLRRRAQP